MIKALKIFAKLWYSVVGLIIFALWVISGNADAYWASPLFPPFSFYLDLILTIIFMLPAIGASKWADRLERKQGTQ